MNFKRLFIGGIKIVYLPQFLLLKRFNPSLNLFQLKVSSSVDTVQKCDECSCPDNRNDYMPDFGRST